MDSMQLEALAQFRHCPPPLPSWLEAIITTTIKCCSDYQVSVLSTLHASSQHFSPEILAPPRCPGRLSKRTWEHYIFKSVLLFS